MQNGSFPKYSSINNNGYKEQYHNLSLMKTKARLSDLIARPEETLNAALEINIKDEQIEEQDVMPEYLLPSLKQGPPVQLTE